MASKSRAVAERQAREAALEKLRARARDREEAVAAAAVWTQQAAEQRQRLAAELEAADEALAVGVGKLADLGESQESIADLTGLAITVVRAARRQAAAPAPRAEGRPGPGLGVSLVADQLRREAAASARLDGDTQTFEVAPA